MKETKTHTSPVQAAPVKNTGGVSLAPPVCEASAPALPVIQPKLLVGHPDDPLEHEADRAAERVVSLWQSGGFAAPAGETPASPAAPLIQRRAAAPAAGTVQASAEVTGQIQSAHGGGQPLPGELLPPLEAAFGMDFSGVRLHTDARADALNRDLQARAFTTGQDIFFRQGEYRPGTAEGVRLLGHELGHVGQQGQGGMKSIQRTLENDALVSIANGLHGADQYNLMESEMHEGVRLLRVHHADLDDIKTVFAREYNILLKDYIKHYYREDYQVKATALLHDDNYREPHTQLALCIIPPLTRDAEFWRLMNGMNAAARRRVQTRYNIVFREIGAGSLWNDIQGDFDGEEEIRAHIMLHRDLTDADRLYLATAGSNGTDEARVLALLRANWARGPEHFETFVNQWNPNATLPGTVDGRRSLSDFFPNLHGIRTPGALHGRLTWNARSLMYTVLDELSLATRNVAARIFIEYLIYKDSANNASEREGSQSSGTASFDATERSNLRIAEMNLGAAGSGLGTDNDEYYGALRQIGAIYRRRIERLTRENAAPEVINVARREWIAREASLYEHDIAGEMNTDYEVLRARLSLAGMDDADRLYLNRNDDDEVLRIVERVYRQGRIDSVIELSQSEKTNSSGQVIRPSFDVILLISATRGDQASRFYLLVRSDRNNADRGAYRIRFELEQGVDEDVVEHLNNFLLQGDWQGGLRNQVLESYRRHFLPQSEIDPGAAFIVHLGTRGFFYINGFSRLRDELTPPRTAMERSIRAGEDSRLERSGPFVAIYDAITGEDTEQVLDESLARLRVFAGRAGASQQELDAFRAIYGADANLSQMEYEGFQERLQDYREARAVIAEFGATATTLVLQAALTVFTGGLAAPLLGSAIAQAIAISAAANIGGMLAREVMDIRGNDLLSADNLQQLIVSSVGAGAGALAQQGTRMGTVFEGMARSELARTALREGFSQTLEQGARVLTAGIRGQLNAEAIQQAALGILLSAAAGGMSSENIRARFRAALPALAIQPDDLIDNFLEDVLQNVTQNVGQEAADMTAQTTNVTGIDAEGTLQRLATGVATAVRDASLGHTGRTGGTFGRAGSGLLRRGSRRQTADHPDAQTHAPEPTHAVPAEPRTVPVPETTVQHAPEPTHAVPAEPRTIPGRETAVPPVPDTLPPGRASSAFGATATPFHQIPHQHVANIHRDPGEMPHQHERRARRHFDERLRADPHREVGLFHNLLTDEWIIIQGDAGSVNLPEPRRNWFGSQSFLQRIADESLTANNWVLEIHSHPSEARGGVHPANRFPSGAEGDFGVLIHRASHNNHQPQRSQIRYLLNNGRIMLTYFGINPGQPRPLWIILNDPSSGDTQRREFEDLQAYHNYLEDRFGIQLAPPVQELEDYLHTPPQYYSIEYPDNVPRSDASSISSNLHDRSVPNVDSQPIQSSAVLPSARFADLLQRLPRTSELITLMEFNLAERRGVIADPILAELEEISSLLSQVEQGPDPTSIMDRIDEHIINTLIYTENSHTLDQDSAPEDLDQLSISDEQSAEMNLDETPIERSPVRENDLIRISMDNPDVVSALEQNLMYLAATHEDEIYFLLVIQSYENQGMLEIGRSPRHESEDPQSLASTEDMRKEFIAAMFDQSASEVAINLMEDHIRSVTRNHTSIDEAVERGDAVWIHRYTGERLDTRTPEAVLWPADPIWGVWRVDHVVELQHGGADNINNYCPVPQRIHALKSWAMNNFGRELRISHSDE